MNSYRRSLHPAKATYVRLVGDLHGQLEDALAEEADAHGLTKASLARRLNWDKSVVTRIFRGQANLTLRTLAYLAWALNRRPRISLDRPEDAHPHNAATTTGPAAPETPPETPRVRHIPARNGEAPLPAGQPTCAKRTGYLG